MTILNKLMFWRKPEPKAPDAFEQIRALAPPYLVNKDYIKYNHEKGSFVVNKEIVVFEYRGAK